MSDLHMHIEEGIEGGVEGEGRAKGDVREGKQLCEGGKDKRASGAFCVPLIYQVNHSL